ncbi:MAG: TylF/MycF/NovP-related O-methyltransferase [Gammaproteobacteria bacterium]
MAPSEMEATFERNYARVERFGKLIRPQVRTIFDRLLEVRHLPGDAIEFGAYQGALSFFLGLCFRDLGLGKKVYMLDSFRGLPETDPAVDGPFRKGAMLASLEVATELRAKLGLERVVEICAGWFEDSVKRLPKEAAYCLAHLDADTYRSTRTALEYLAPRLVQGGAIVLDDCVFHGATGVLLAAEEVLGKELHLHLGPKTQAYAFPTGDPRHDRPDPVWKSLGGRQYDVAALRARADYRQLVEQEGAFFAERAQWYRDYLECVLGDGAPDDNAHRIASLIGVLHRR